MFGTVGKWLDALEHRTAFYVFPREDGTRFVVVAFGSTWLQLEYKIEAFGGGYGLSLHGNFSRSDRAVDDALTLRYVERFDVRLRSAFAAAEERRSIEAASLDDPPPKHGEPGNGIAVGPAIAQQRPPFSPFAAEAWKVLSPCHQRVLWNDLLGFRLAWSSDPDGTFQIADGFWDDGDAVLTLAIPGEGALCFRGTVAEWLFRAGTLV